MILVVLLVFPNIAFKMQYLIKSEESFSSMAAAASFLSVEWLRAEKVVLRQHCFKCFKHCLLSRIKKKP